MSLLTFWFSFLNVSFNDLKEERKKRQNPPKCVRNLLNCVGGHMCIYTYSPSTHFPSFSKSNKIPSKWSCTGWAGDGRMCVGGQCPRVGIWSQIAGWQCGDRGSSLVIHAEYFTKRAAQCFFLSITTRLGFFH